MNNIYALAQIKGNEKYPNIIGYAFFKPVNSGIICQIEINNLPNKKDYEWFPIHIHGGENCSMKNGKFNNIKDHYNPENRPHPYHKGDLPVLFSNNGYAFMTFYTTNFKLSEIENKLVVIHEPSDNDNPTTFGEKIACGKIEMLTL